MEDRPYTHLSKGAFLIASPDNENGIYFRSVVILCEHSGMGSFGLIINKSFTIELPEEILNTRELINPNVQIRAGGPMQQNQMLLLHSSPMIPEQTLQLCEGVYLGGDLQFLQEAVSNPEGPALRLMFGYCGWAAGQLEREFLDGYWFLHQASSPLIFETPADKVWQSVLRQMGGKYATLSMIPEDLSLN